MLDCILNIDWKFWIGDIIIPIATFVGGIFVGKTIERKAQSKISGDKNTVIQNSNINKEQHTVLMTMIFSVRLKNDTHLRS